jgi:exodeoxyribonuclease-3
LELIEEQIRTNFKGVYTIANAQIASTKLTLISMYGLLYKGRFVMKNLNDMVSELENGLIISDLDKNIILGGDLNASVQWDEKQNNNNHQDFFERLRRHQLEDCFKLLNKPYPLQTLRKINSDIPWQNDYLFISKRFEGNLIYEDKIIIDTPEVVNLSDHNIVIITLDL